FHRRLLVACCTSLPLLLHLYCRASRSVQPSFPTRRSSDLIGGAGQGARAQGALAVHPAGGVHKAAQVPQQHPGIGHQGVAEGDRDRKSTRLNSSHVSISYAVFCLKKKNIKEDDEP